MIKKIIQFMNTILKPIDFKIDFFPIDFVSKVELVFNGYHIEMITYDYFVIY